MRIGVELDTRIGVTVLTGFLGSGKTTLLRRVLQLTDARDTLVLVNEFGELGVDQTLIRQVSGRVVVLPGGCLCCTVRSDLLDALREMFMHAMHKRVPRFARVIIETTGLADAAAVMFSLKNDVFIAQRYRYDGCVAVVDALNIAQQLDRFVEVRRQLALADAVFIAKADLLAQTATASTPSTPSRAPMAQGSPACNEAVTAPTVSLASVVQAVSAVNPLAEVSVMTPAFDLQAAWHDVKAIHYGQKVPGPGQTLFGRGRSALRPAPHTPVGSFVVTTGAWRRGPFMTALERALTFLGDRSLRVKGWVRFSGETTATLFQVVHQQRYPLTELTVAPSEDTAIGSGELVFIVSLMASAGASGGRSADVPTAAASEGNRLAPPDLAVIQAAITQQLSASIAA